MVERATATLARVKPRIGILRSAERLDARYAEALAEMGAAAVALGAGAGLDGLDGLLVPGGGDFAPARPYPAAVAFELVPAEQLASDAALLDAALARGLPVLGICYGMQLLAQRCGGTFVYDIATDCPEAAPHRLPEPDGRHAIDVRAGSRLAELLGVTSLQVNSSHHQAVLEPGRGLRAVARARDGLIEAIESADRSRFVLGVQWHPERMEPAHRRHVFGALTRRGT